MTSLPSECFFLYQLSMPGSRKQKWESSSFNQDGLGDPGTFLCSLVTPSVSASEASLTECGKPCVHFIRSRSGGIELESRYRAMLAPFLPNSTILEVEKKAQAWLAHSEGSLRSQRLRDSCASTPSARKGALKVYTGFHHPGHVFRA